MTQQRSSRRSARAGVLVLAIVLALVAAACSGGSDDAGGGGGSPTTASGGSGDGYQDINPDDCDVDPESVTIEGDTIKLGTSIPQSGLYSAFQEILRGEQAYIEYVNTEKGGFDVGGKKYKVELIAKDDAYEASRTVTNVQSLITSDEVFGLFDVVGTKNNLAIRDNVNDACIPGLFAATGSPAWGNKNYPWIIGTFLVPYPDEMKALVDYLKENQPAATIAVLRANDDFGKAYSESLAKLVEGTDLRIVKEEVYDPESPDTKSQVTSLAATKADVFVVGATLLACPDALKNAQAAGWTRKVTYMSGTCTSKTLMAIAGDSAGDVYSVAPLMDPNNPEYAEQPGMKLYKEKVKQYEPEADVTNGIVAYGWTVGALLERTLADAKSGDRLGVMEAARNLTDVKGLALQLPGISWSVGADDWFLGEQFSMVQYQLADQYFSTVGPLVKLDGETAEITPPALIDG
ncbi:MAG: ABC transporter substrate-binding protein [Actinomycetota bacterium]